MISVQKHACVAQGGLIRTFRPKVAPLGRREGAAANLALSLRTSTSKIPHEMKGNLFALRQPVRGTSDNKNKLYTLMPFRWFCSWIGAEEYEVCHQIQPPVGSICHVPPIAEMLKPAQIMDHSVLSGSWTTNSGGIVLARPCQQ